jgi:hypothetical protein
VAGLSDRFHQVLQGIRRVVRNHVNLAERPLSLLGQQRTIYQIVYVAETEQIGAVAEQPSESTAMDGLKQRKPKAGFANTVDRCGSQDNDREPVLIMRFEQYPFGREFRLSVFGIGVTQRVLSDHLLDARDTHGADATEIDETPQVFGKTCLQEIPHIAKSWTGIVKGEMIDGIYTVNEIPHRGLVANIGVHQFDIGPV